MIFVIVRIALQVLRRAGVDVPALPSLRMRRTLMERALEQATMDGQGRRGGLGRTSRYKARPRQQ